MRDHCAAGAIDRAGNLIVGRLERRARDEPECDKVVRADRARGSAARRSGYRIRVCGALRFSEI